MLDLFGEEIQEREKHRDWSGNQRGVFSAKEVWKPIFGFPKYEISSKGRVKSLYYNGSKQLNPHILGDKFDGHGYKVVCLYRDKKVYYKSVHRLVASAFIPNPKGYGDINHKDENPLNNSIENLEWCTRKYNLNYGGHNERMAKSKKGKKMSERARAIHRLTARRGENHPGSVPVVRIKDGRVLERWPNQRMAALALDVTPQVFFGWLKRKTPFSDGSLIRRESDV